MGSMWTGAEHVRAEHLRAAAGARGRAAMAAAEERIPTRPFEDLDARSREHVRLDRLLRDRAPAMAEAADLKCIVDAEPVRTSESAARRLLVALNELMLNARAHAYPDGRPALVGVKLRPAAGGGATLLVIDGGGGLPPDFDPRRGGGVGMRALTAVVDALGGAVETCRSQGARFTISLPAEVAAAPDQPADSRSRALSRSSLVSPPILRAPSAVSITR